MQSRTHVLVVNMAGTTKKAAASVTQPHFRLRGHGEQGTVEYYLHWCHAGCMEEHMLAWVLFEHALSWCHSFVVHALSLSLFAHMSMCPEDHLVHAWFLSAYLLSSTVFLAIGRLAWTLAESMLHHTNNTHAQSAMCIMLLCLQSSWR